MIDDAGNVIYRGHTLVLSERGLDIWDGPKYMRTIYGPPQETLLRAKKIIDAIV